MPYVIAALNSNGDTGTTTIGTNLAGCMHTHRHRIILVDADPQGYARDWHALLANRATMIRQIANPYAFKRGVTKTHNP